jgi:hypothetical protein
MDKIYYEDDRARIRAALTNEQHSYVIALEKIACVAYHVWSNTPHASKPPEIAVAYLNDLYDALAIVDFMEGDETRDES